MAGRRKVGLATAGREVTRLAQSFSDALLEDEIATFEKIDMAFAVGIPPARAAVAEALKGVDGEPSALKAGSPIATTLRGLYADGLKTAEGHVVALSEVAFTKALAAINAELTVCESALAARYDGLADDATNVVENRATALRSAQMTLYRQAVADVLPTFTAMLGTQFREAVDERTLMLRLFSPDPAGLRGFGGRGIWWQALSDVKASARALSIGTANTTRLEAMREFNAGYDVRGAA